MYWYIYIYYVRDISFLLLFTLLAVETGFEIASKTRKPSRLFKHHVRDNVLSTFIDTSIRFILFCHYCNRRNCPLRQRILEIIKPTSILFFFLQYIKFKTHLPHNICLFTVDFSSVSKNRPAIDVSRQIAFYPFARFSVQTVPLRSTGMENHNVTLFVSPMCLKR